LGERFRRKNDRCGDFEPVTLKPYETRRLAANRASVVATSALSKRFERDEPRHAPQW
jgi:hypothetical protein